MKMPIKICYNGNKRIIRIAKTILLILLLHGVSFAAEDEDDYYFYKPALDFGSEAMFNPVSVMINGSFDILRNGYGSRDIRLIEFNNGFRNVNRLLWHADEIIAEYNRVPGHNFWVDQVFPLGHELNAMGWWPNYKLHLIGEGMVCRKLSEWYDYHKVPWPYFWAIVNTAAFQYLNEVVENGPIRYNSVDPIADLLIFNPLGWALFAIDPVAKFFSHTLNLDFWQPQPVFNPANGVLTNAGEQFIGRINVPGLKKYQVFYSFGIDGVGGVTYKGTNGNNYSMGAGMRANRLKESILSGQRIVYPELEPHFAFFMDRSGSLVLSITQTSVKEINLIINCYPGLAFNRNWGLYFAVNTYLGPHLGITYINSPIGLFMGR
jgi:hypothetical protein